MTADATPNTASTGATAAFLRGVERRAVVFAQCQCGSSARGDAAVAAALLAFKRIAPDAPMATWPVRFWSLLLAAPDLRRSADDAVWPPVFESFAGLGNGPRAALLLRLVGGLEMDDAAAALGVQGDAYRTALQRAIPYREDGTPDREAWGAWVAAVREATEGMPAERLARLHVIPSLRAAQSADASPSHSATPTPHATTHASTHAPMRAEPLRPMAAARARKPHRRRPLAVAAAAIAIVGGVVAVIALRPQWIDHLPLRGDKMRTEALPPAEAPVARYDADFGAWTHRDFLAIADPAGVARADTLPFFAWHAAQLAVQPAPDARQPAATATAPVPAAALAEATPAFVAPPRAQPIAIPQDVVLPEPTRMAIARAPEAMQAELRDQATLWHAWTAAQRADFVQRARQWDAQPRAAQARLRERHAAWRRLNAVAAEAVENAVQDFARRTPEEQRALRAQYDALEPLAQRGWLLGPAIGGDYPRLQPLIAQLPEAQRMPMLQALARMTAAERADLSVLAQRVPPMQRDELVRTLLSTADDRRAAWLQVRLAQ